jgi:hypothetical protein
MLEASAKSPAMLIFLDATTNVLAAPNENYARELLELHSMGVDGGYTQTDVEQLARVLTGWSFCRRRGRRGESACPLHRELLGCVGRRGLRRQFREQQARLRNEVPVPADPAGGD